VAMKKFFKCLAIVLAVLVLAIGLFLFGMRFSDGPLAIISGGPFKTGETSPAPDDWSFLQDRDTIEFQTMDPATSRTVWLAVHEGRLFFVSGYMTTGYGKLWKQWPHYIEQDNNVILRIDGKLYNQRLERNTGGPLAAEVMEIFGQKYNLGAGAGDIPVTSGDVWMFEVVDP